MLTFFIALVVILVVCYIWKVSSEAQEKKEEQNNPTAPAAMAATPATPAATPVAAPVQQDDSELIAVITAAIAAISEGANVNIVSISRGGEAWVMSGRQDLMGGL